MTVHGNTPASRISNIDALLQIPDLLPTSIFVKDDEVELEAKEARYRALAETVPVGIWHLHENGKTIYADPFLLTLLGKLGEGAWFTTWFSIIQTLEEAA